MDNHESLEGNQTIHVLYTNSFTHFNLLFTTTPDKKLMLDPNKNPIRMEEELDVNIEALEGKGEKNTLKKQEMLAEEKTSIPQMTPMFKQTTSPKMLGQKRQNTQGIRIILNKHSNEKYSVNEIIYGKDIQSELKHEEGSHSKNKRERKEERKHKKSE